MVLVVRTPADLELFINSIPWANLFSQPRLVISNPLLSESELVRRQEEFDRLRQSCGCSHGAISLCVFLAFFIGYAVYFDPLAHVPVTGAALLIRAAIFVTGLIVSTIGGKLFGLYLADRQLRQACRSLQSRLLELSSAAGPEFLELPRK
jgi:hypothetical protein